MDELSNQFHRTAGSFDLGLGTLGDTMNTHFNGGFQFTTSQDRNRVARIAQQACFLKRFGGDFKLGFEGSQLVKVDFVEFNFVRRGKAFTTYKRQAAEEWQIATLPVETSTRTSAGALAFGTTAGRLSLTCRDATTNALAFFLGPELGLRSFSFIFVPTLQYESGG